MKFSIVIPLYNKAAYVESAINSVLAQSFTDYEIVVIDDGSTDDSGDIVAKMTDPRIRLVRQKNAGVSQARNLAISIAKGEWVAFLDADDWHHPAYLETLVQAQKLYPQANVVATTFLAVSNRSEQIWPPFWKLPAEPIKVELIDNLAERWMHSPTLYTSSVAVRTSELCSIQPCFALGESYGEDVDLWFRLSERSGIALSHAPLVGYRVSLENSLSSQRQQLVIPPFLHRMRLRAESGQLSAARSRALITLLGHYEVTIAREAIIAGQRPRAIKFLMRCTNATRSLRWWVTVIMAAVMPGNLIYQWQNWRIRRSSSLMQPEQTSI